MRTTQYLLSTLRNEPSDSELVSHNLMLRAGMIRKLASGLYIWLPTGLRVLKKVENIIREEMNNIGALEISMPIVQPADLWKESGRWENYGLELLRFFDRSNRSFVLGPTNEEVITNLIRYELSSYKQLPLNLFQIQTKFRDEIRPRFGVIRSREFLMKDGYSFHATQDSLQETYSAMYHAYSHIFKRIGLNFCVVEADSGRIGGQISHEFHILAQSGDNCIALSTESEYAANIDIAEAISTSGSRNSSTKIKREFETEGVTNIRDLVTQFDLSLTDVVQTIIVQASKESSAKFIALLVRGDHQLNIIKAESIDIVAKPLRFASEEELREQVGVNSFSLGPVGLKIPIIADRSVSLMNNFITGANIDGWHLSGINWERDLPIPRIEDIRNVVTGDISPDGKGTIFIKRGIEVGHIFQLGEKYSRALDVCIQDKDRQRQVVRMGCYGIGISRLIAASIEQSHDERGIIWPTALSPFQIAILPMNMHKLDRIKNIAEDIYSQLSALGIDVIFDDRKEGIGVMFSDMELIGIPHLIVISERHLRNSEVEYQCRRSYEKHMIKISDIVLYLIDLLKKVSSSY
ncbi:Proline--tRNA ligase [Candidatus Erwinia haradaeae]|uniref:Proline--tRNA ligase n=1 Tax=Candidatus Erwinia haradaeae TaxID=1922217 RepID=A0A451CYS5_9GAMM|nr:proline--tRNA ligase [Candidatus Erwinia haradaeae]VFP78544.1 Proline--tRNA ligase [Candidatus Erwinia haradaeae]